MYLAKLAAGGTTAPAPPGHERFVFVLDGGVNVTGRGKAAGQTLHANDYVYHPPGDVQGLSSDHGAGLLIYERKYMLDVCCFVMVVDTSPSAGYYRYAFIIIFTLFPPRQSSSPYPFIITITQPPPPLPS